MGLFHGPKTKRNCALPNTIGAGMSVDLEMVKLQDTKKGVAPGVQPRAAGLEL